MQGGVHQTEVNLGRHIWSTLWLGLVTAVLSARSSLLLAAALCSLLFCSHLLSNYLNSELGSEPWSVGSPVSEAAQAETL